MENISPQIITHSTARSTGQLEEMAQLVLKASRGYYEQIFDRTQETIPYLITLLTEPDSELGASYCLEKQNQLQGLYIGFASEELAARQIISMRTALESLKGVTLIERLTQLKDQLAPIAPKAFYLSKIAVPDKLQGLGHGRTLMSHFEKEALSHGFKLASLHVHEANTRAIGFYARLGYLRQPSAKTYPFQTFTKMLSAR